MNAGGAPDGVEGISVPIHVPYGGHLIPLTPDEHVDGVPFLTAETVMTPGAVIPSFAVDVAACNEAFAALRYGMDSVPLGKYTPDVLYLTQKRRRYIYFVWGMRLKLGGLFLQILNLLHA